MRYLTINSKPIFASDLAINSWMKVSSMHKHPKTSSEALHPSDFKGDKVDVPMLSDKAPLVQSRKGH